MSVHVSTKLCVCVCVCLCVGTKGRGSLDVQAVGLDHKLEQEAHGLWGEGGLGTSLIAGDWEQVCYAQYIEHLAQLHLSLEVTITLPNTLTELPQEHPGVGVE